MFSLAYVQSAWRAEYTPPVQGYVAARRGRRGRGGVRAASQCSQQQQPAVPPSSLPAGLCYVGPQCTSAGVSATGAPPCREGALSVRPLATACALSTLHAARRGCQKCSGRCLLRGRALPPPLREALRCTPCYALTTPQWQCFPPCFPSEVSLGGFALAEIEAQRCLPREDSGQ